MNLIGRRASWYKYLTDIFGRHMKRCLAVGLLTASFAWAADAETVVTSAGPLQGALEALPNASNTYFYPIHIPGYGLQLNGIASPDVPEESQVDPMIDSISTVLQGLAGTIQGLDEGDWVSVGASIFSGPHIDVVVRMKPNQPNSLEVFVNGRKR